VIGWASRRIGLDLNALEMEQLAADWSRLRVDVNALERALALKSGQAWRRSRWDAVGRLRERRFPFWAPTCGHGLDPLRRRRREPDRPGVTHGGGAACGLRAVERRD